MFPDKANCGERWHWEQRLLPSAARDPGSCDSCDCEGCDSDVVSPQPVSHEGCLAPLGAWATVREACPPCWGDSAERSRIRGHAGMGALVAPGLPEVLGAGWTGPQTTMAAADIWGNGSSKLTQSTQRIRRINAVTVVSRHSLGVVCHTRASGDLALTSWLRGSEACAPCLSAWAPSTRPAVKPGLRLLNPELNSVSQKFMSTQHVTFTRGHPG